MESIEKLRKLTICDKGEKYTAYLDAGNIADEIEREIAEKYMELPVDADDVPIHVGENLRSACSETEYTALGFWFDFDCGIWQVMVSSKQAMSGNMLRHVKPDPIKELLNDHLQEREKIVRKLESNLITLGEAESEEDACDKLFAERIRELLGGERR